MHERGRVRLADWHAVDNYADRNQPSLDGGTQGVAHAFWSPSKVRPRTRGLRPLEGSSAGANVHGRAFEIDRVTIVTHP